MLGQQSLFEVDVSTRAGQLQVHASVRERFGIDKKNSATTSRLIKEAVDARMIVPFDPSASAAPATPPLMRQYPHWPLRGRRVLALRMEGDERCQLRRSVRHVAW